MATPQTIVTGRSVIVPKEWLKKKNGEGSWKRPHICHRRKAFEKFLRELIEAGVVPATAHFCHGLPEGWADLPSPLKHTEDGDILLREDVVIVVHPCDHHSVVITPPSA